MKIEIWSDMVCPFCYIGKHQLEKALHAFPEKDKVNIEFKSYQLDPTTPPYAGQDFYESMAPKFGGVEQAKQMMTNVVDHAKAAGLAFHFDTMKPANTFDAHRLMKFAETKNKANVLVEKILYANFTESKDIGNIDVLAGIAEEVGLNREEVTTVLQDPQAFSQAVYQDIDEAKALGVTGVPYFVFNRKYALSGAQAPEAFLQALEKVHEEEQATPTFESLAPDNNNDTTCGDDGCAISTDNQ